MRPQPQNSAVWLARAALLLVGFIPLMVISQDLNFRLQRDIMLQVEKAAVFDTNRVHLGNKPIAMSQINLDRMGLYGTDTTDYYYQVTEIAFSRHLFHLKKPDFEVMIDPLLNFQFGRDYQDSLSDEIVKHKTRNTRGLRVQGRITDKVYFMASFYENQAYFTEYVNEHAELHDVIPGHGRWKPFKRTGYDYAMSTGYVVVTPTKFLRIQYGHDKNFIGHGYRSLLLSDNSHNYPHLRIVWSAWKNRIQYTSVFAKAQSLRRMPIGETREPNFAPKGFSYNYLSIMPWKFLEIGFYEAFIWRMYDGDTDERTPFIANTINPVIFTNTAAYGLDDANNGVLGLNIRVQPVPSVQLYGQLMADDFKSNKLGYQGGVKWFNAVVPNLDLQLEFNKVKPYTYGKPDPLQSYTHFNEYLAHPWGAGFDELVGFVNYRWRRLMAEVKFIWGEYQRDYRSEGADVRTNFGKEIIRREDPGLAAFDENPARHTAQDIRISYVINPSYNLMFNVGYTNRIVDSPYYESNTSFIYFGLRTYIDNQYFDF